MIFVGIDTSCYTTSVALVNEYGEIIAEKRKMLSVPDGDRGLRQSEAFFKHINNFPELYAEVIRDQELKNIAAVGVSAQPRSNNSSYMPVFYAGLRLAEVLSLTAGVPLYKSDHQQGHIAAAMHESELTAKSFISVHISGGTTDILKVKVLPEGYNCSILAASSDINAGQLIDRVGVALGMPFPSGKYMDEMAVQYMGEPLVLPISASVTACSFSGTEAAAMREIEKGVDKRALANGVMSAVCRTITKMLSSAAYYEGIRDVLLVGGVSSSKYLREYLPVMLKKRGCGVNLHFATPTLSADNAVGIAKLTMKKYLLKE